MPHHLSSTSSDCSSQLSRTTNYSTIFSKSSPKPSSFGPNSHIDSSSKYTQTKDRKTSKSKHKKEVETNPYEEYFIQQAKLFRHLEKRYIKFQKKQKEEQARARENRYKRFTPVPKSTQKKTTTTEFRKDKNTSIDRTHQPNTDISESNSMIGPSVSAIRGQAGRALSQASRPVSVTRVSSPVPTAPFSSSASSSIRSQKSLPKKKKKVVNPDAMTASEATRVLRALEIANPTSSYSLTLSTKSTKSSLPIRGHFHLPLDPRRSSETILVFAEPNSPSSNLAKAAGAAYVGGEELFESVLSGKISPTRCLATPGMMPQVTRNLARYLGPKGLMPVAKRGLVGEGQELADKIRDAAGRMEYRADKEGLVRIPVARMDFEIPSVENNIRSFIQTVRDNQSAGTTDDAVTAAAKKKKKGKSIHF
uniref:50S small subunit ribosomal protein L1 n=1 Tax=Kwoniella pini CBS 10737 TaxID=1296096 RepID=A0A1B9HTK1_9TREE|nr:50S small subunit ribosomal protein L1 [Kwoniella pini CBS 10737]OCF46596.1 50S small subunit ribosomal protein L1 [Kwoniella pini CBS 10737]